MGEITGISWTDSTFNPWVGCTNVSPGCDHCYAETYDKRVGGHAVTRAPRWGTGAPRQRTTEANWRKPVQWNARGLRTRVFCSSLFDLIRRTPNLDWQLLTKRPEHIMTGLRCAADVVLGAAATAMRHTSGWAPPSKTWPASASGRADLPGPGQ